MSPASERASLQRPAAPQLKSGARRLGRAPRAPIRTRACLLARGTALLVRLEPHAQIVFLDAPSSPPLPPARFDTCLTLLGWFAGSTLRCWPTCRRSSRFDACRAPSFEELRPLLALLREDEAQLLSLCARAAGLARAPSLIAACAARRPSRATPDTCWSCTSAPAALSSSLASIRPSSCWSRAATQALLGRQAVLAPGTLLRTGRLRRAGREPGGNGGARGEEETGVQVESVRYFASQPWPFPPP